MHRRTFLKLSALGAAAWAGVRLAAGRTVAVVRAVCTPWPGTALPMEVPTEVGEDCAPVPTLTPSPTGTATWTTSPTATATATSTSTPSPTPTATATPAPEWRVWLPVVRR